MFFRKDKPPQHWSQAGRLTSRLPQYMVETDILVHNIYIKPFGQALREYFSHYNFEHVLIFETEVQIRNVIDAGFCYGKDANPGWCRMRTHPIDFVACLLDADYDIENVIVTLVQETSLDNPVLVIAFKKLEDALSFKLRYNLETIEK